MSKKMTDLKQNEPYVLTLDKIKEIVSFDKKTPIYKSLIELIDCWYAIERQNGKTEIEALVITLHKLGEKMLSFSNDCEPTED